MKTTDNILGTMSILHAKIKNYNPSIQSQRQSHISRRAALAHHAVKYQKTWHGFTSLAQRRPGGGFAVVQDGWQFVILATSR